MEILKKYSLLDEVYAHCIASITTSELVLKQLSNPIEIQNKNIWINLQTALVHATITANYIYSQKPTAKLRTDFLKETIKPSSGSPLYNRNARNYLIHIDEKFDHWLNDIDKYNGMVESVLPNRKAFDYLNDSKKFIRRIILKEELIFIYQVNDEIRELELNPILEEIHKIRVNTEAALKTLEKGNNNFHIIRP